MGITVLPNGRLKVELEATGPGAAVLAAKALAAHEGHRVQSTKKVACLRTTRIGGLFRVVLIPERPR